MNRFLKIIICTFLSLIISFSLAEAAKVTKTPDELLADGKKLYEQKKYAGARKCFEKLIDTYPTSSLIDDARYFKGMCLFYRDRFEDAAAEFKIVTERYPASEWADDSQLQLGLCSIKRAPAISFDQNMTRQALLDFYTMIDEYPESNRMSDVYAAIAEARNRLADKDLMVGKFYQKTGKPKSAIIYYENIIADYDTYPRIAETYYRLAICQVRIGNIEVGRNNFQKILDLYPDSKSAPKARHELTKLSQAEGSK